MSGTMPRQVKPWIRKLAECEPGARGNSLPSRSLLQFLLHGSCLELLPCLPLGKDWGMDVCAK